MNRRQWLHRMGIMAGAAALPGSAVTSTVAQTAATEPETALPARPHPPSIALPDYEPKSMLHVPETQIDRARFPAIDIHTHISVSSKAENGVELVPDREYLGTPQELLAVMDRKNIRAMVNLTGGYDKGLSEAVTKYDRTFPGRFYTFTAFLLALQGAELSGTSSAGDRAGASGWREGS